MVVDQQILLDEEKLNVDLLHITHFLQLRIKWTGRKDQGLLDDYFHV